MRRRGRDGQLTRWVHESGTHFGRFVGSPVRGGRSFRWFSARHGRALITGALASPATVPFGMAPLGALRRALADLERADASDLTERRASSHKRECHRTLDSMPRLEEALHGVRGCPQVRWPLPKLGRTIPPPLPTYLHPSPCPAPSPRRRCARAAVEARALGRALAAAPPTEPAAMADLADVGSAACSSLVAALRLAPPLRRPHRPTPEPTRSRTVEDAAASGHTPSPSPRLPTGRGKRGTPGPAGMADVTRSVVVSPPSPQAEALAAVMGLVASLSHVVADASPASGPAAAGGVTRTMLLRFARGLLAVSDASLLSPPLLASLGSSLFSSQVPDLRRALKEDLPRILCAGAATGATGAAASMDSEEERSVGALAGDCLAELFSQTRALSLSTACEGRTPAVSASGPDVVLDARLCALAAGAPGNEVLRSFASLNCLAVALTGALASLSPGALASTRWPSAEMDAERLPGGRAAAAVVVHLVDCVVGISRLQSSHLGTWPGSPEVAAASVASAGRVARFWVQRLAQTARGCRAGAAASAGVLACALTELEALVAEAEQRGASRVSDNVDAAAANFLRSFLPTIPFAISRSVKIFSNASSRALMARAKWHL